jgi:hypothetical protein
MSKKKKEKKPKAVEPEAEIALGGGLFSDTKTQKPYTEFEFDSKY